MVRTKLCVMLKKACFFDPNVVKYMSCWERCTLQQKDRKTNARRIQPMKLIRADRKLAGTIIGWATAAALAVGGFVCVKNIASRDLSLVLCIDGETVCTVESRAVVNQALLKLDEKLAANGSIYSGGNRITYKYVPSDGEDELADAEECLDLLFDRYAEDYKRAYMISVSGNDIAACATYAEAEAAVSVFRDYIVGYVEKTDGSEGDIELTTEFEIRNVFCSAARISTAEALEKRLAEGLEDESDLDAGSISDTRVTATGSSFLLSPDRYLSYGFVKKDGLADSGSDSNISFTLNGLQSAIAYKSVVTEKYTEIFSPETEYIESDELYVGQTEVVEEGSSGIAENTYEVSYADGVEISRELVSSVTISEAVRRVELVGTKQYPSTDPTGSFMWPLSGSFIVYSSYGSRPGVGVGNFHTGVDLAGVKIGDEVIAADGGVVTFAGDAGSYGILVKLLHEDGVETYYAHMRVASVKEGDKVYKGQKVGEVGITGVTTGPHLHFEVRIDGKTVNPLNYLPKKRR